jgi:tRNA(fMet)-specific endonuclease VapC
LSVYLLDTNTCVEYRRNRNQGVIHRVRGEPTQNIRLCSVVLGELYYGAFRSADPVKNLTILRRFVSKFKSLPYDDDASEVYGIERVRLESAGTPIGPHDMPIASIALRHSLIVVTHNVSEFSRVPGLNVEDWHV